MKAITKNRMIEEAMERVMYAREMQTAYMACISFLQKKDRDFSVANDKVYTGLMQAELTEWRNLLVCTLVCDNDTQDRIKAAVHERFLADKMHVASWFHDGESPRSWLASDEQEFRDMAMAAFAPRKEGEQ